MSITFHDGFESTEADDQEPFSTHLNVKIQPANYIESYKNGGSLQLNSDNKELRLNKCGAYIRADGWIKIIVKESEAIITYDKEIMIDPIHHDL